MIWVDLHTLELHVDTFFGHGQFPALDDLDGQLGLVAGVLLDVLDLLDDFVALKDLAENNVLAVQPAIFRVHLLVSGEVCHFSWEGPPGGGEVIRGTYEVMAVVMKNCEPLVSLPALAMERRPFLVCLSLKFSSGNLSPKTVIAIAR